MATPATSDRASPVDLRGLGLDETVAWAVETLGQPRYRGEQLWRWVHGHQVASFEAMSNLPKELRERLARDCQLTTLIVDRIETSSDGTRKLRLLTGDQRAIESVLIPDGDKLTQCISSQVGCALGCRFCATARLGFGRNLTAGEIVDQVYRARALLTADSPGTRISNLVYMGMGEPLNNYDNLIRSLEILTHELGANLSQRRITVSTAGVVPRIEQLGRETVRPNLAISLNAPSDQLRGELMPINRKYNLSRLLAALRAYPLERRRRITFEYVMLAGVNDRLEDAAALAQLLRGFPAKLNLIPWNPHPGADYQRPDPAVVEEFQNRVKELGVATYLRTPRGDDIAAACGQLAGKAATTTSPVAPVATGETDS